MTRKDYEKPAMEVVEVKQQVQLLAGSPLNNPDDYPDGGDPFNF